MVKTTFGHASGTHHHGLISSVLQKQAYAKLQSVCEHHKAIS
jgi:hypothetical protein